MSQPSSRAASLLWQGSDGNSNWDIGASTNWLAGGSLSVYADGDDVTFDDSALSFSPLIVGTLQPDSITVNATNDYAFTGSGVIAGTTGLFKTGSGILTLDNPNTFSGSIVVDDGILRYASSNSLAPLSVGVIYVTNNGSLDVIGGATGTNKEIAVAGAGYQGQGAIITSPNSGGVNTIVGSITLLGDTTIGCTNGSRWDTANGGIFNGNGYKLTKIGGGSTYLYRCNETGLGDIEVAGGTLGLYYPLGVGNSTNTILVDAGTELSLYGGFPAFNKNIVLTNSELWNAFTGSTTTGTNILLEPITLLGTNNVIDTFAVMILSNGIAGTGGFTKTDANTLYLYGTNTYTGPTLIQGGEIVLGPNSTLGTNSIDLNGGSLDISANASGLNVVGGQSLITGNGSTINGTVNLQIGSELTVGINGPGLLNVGQMSLSGATVQTVLGTDPSDMSGSVNSLININGNLSLSGITTIEVEPWGVLSSGSPYIVAQYSGAFTGDASNLQVVSMNPAYTFTVLDPATTAPYIEIVPSGSVPSLTWVGGTAGAPTLWDIATTANWFNSASSQSGVFNNGDAVTFDDTALTNEVTVSGVTAAAVTFNNNNLNYVFNGGGTLNGTLELDGSASVTMAMTNLPTPTTLNLNSGTLVLDSPVVGGKYTIAAPISGYGTLTLAGSNTVVLANTNIYTYEGVIIVTNGVLQNSANNSLAFGDTPNPLYVTNGGTLDLVGGGGGAGVKDLEVAGAGYNGQGALNYSGTSTANQVLARYIDLVGDTTVGSSGRWNASGTLNGNGYNLTKVGSGSFWLYSLSGDTDIGDITITSGTLAAYGSGSYQILGDPTKTITVEKGATMEVYQKPTAIKNLVLNQGTLASGYSVANGYDYWVGQITLNYTNTFSVGTNLWISNSISGPGGFTKTGVYTLGLVGTACTYTGPTFISAGTVLVGTNVTLASSLISISSGAHLDVSQPSTFPLGNGQKLGGAGTLIGGNVVFGSGATLETSLSDATVATLTASGNLSFQAGSTNRVVVNKGTTLTNNKVTGAASVTFGGTLAIVSIGANALSVGDAIPLFSATNYSGSFGAITPSTPGSGLTWDTSTLATDGTLRVASSGVVDTTPTNIVAQVTNNQLSLFWPADHLGWMLQVQTNALDAGLGTNWVNVVNSVTNTQISLPIDRTSGSVFYRLIYPATP